MRTLVALLAGTLLLAGCHAPLSRVFVLQPPASVPPLPSVGSVPPLARASLGEGAAPGDARGPGGFVPRGALKNFYSAGGGRLWYYMNNYYWVSSTAPEDDLWIKAEVIEEFQDLRTWPDGTAATAPPPKVTVEYWEVGPNRRSVRLDSHKDFCLLSDQYTAGAIAVQVTLTLGRLRVRAGDEGWEQPKEAYVLESRNYSKRDGIGADRARFDPLSTEDVTVWAYRVPWSTHPQRVTRSSWRRLELPTWELLERRFPPGTAVPVPVVTPRSEQPAGR